MVISVSFICDPVPVRCSTISESSRDSQNSNSQSCWTVGLAIGFVWLAAFPLLAGEQVPGERSLDRVGTQWAPFMEWELKNPGHQGNPFDLTATATFTHVASGETRTTGMFPEGNDTWKFRFTATRPGNWTFTTQSAASKLNGLSGNVTVRPNEEAHGFVTNLKNRWARPKGVEGKLEVFVPQLVMYAEPNEFFKKPRQIEADIQTFLVEHGFSGFHVPVSCRWFDLEKDRARDIGNRDPNPDPRTFEALEMLIIKTHQAGGMVHLWAWGDEQRTMTPIRLGGINGPADRRLQRYIATRLGPLPGWTLGYGFDLWEWVNEEQLLKWHRDMHQHLGWPTILGGRAHRHGRPLENLFTDRLDYIGFETHRPDYETYAKALEMFPDKPVFMEDRFRIRDSRYSEKDYDEALTRRGLWHSAMAGGVANIWGYLHGKSFSESASRPYPRPHWIKTNAEFLRGRFLPEWERDNEITDGVALRSPDRERFLIYREETDSIRLDLSGMPAAQKAVAVDALKPYEELDVGTLQPKQQVWKAPYKSDWAIAIGEFAR